MLSTARAVSREPQGRVAFVLQVLAGAMLLGAGITHLTIARAEFQAQVPHWFPADPDVVVLISGVLEILIGASVIFLRRWRALTGLVMTLFLIAVFPGNIWQYLDHVDGFGLNTDQARLGRLIVEPLLWAWALFPSGGWRLLVRLVRGSPADAAAPQATA
ncbi:hypothetical protein GCM10010168_18660 [Actinoplanes ianthinogenes]|uniref:DoxX family membrane protein n=1 Tax=Actinoplanes ianthinogenes TaxID=122358 RepID=A0ABM7M773_9ACTN|nr:hypothetical protein Aiant_81650 [Actinoplanes ianthinogenes]GGR02244.1 hypothetical protein GCM10010168_18660 [Actinoplanes ianthinogenes]